MTAEEHTQVWNAAVSNTVECVLEILEDVELIRGLSKADEYSLLRMKVKELKGEQE